MQLSDLLTYIKYDFKRTDKDTEITRAINDAIYWIASQMPHGNYKYQDWITTVTGQEDIPLPSTLIHLMHPVRFLEGAATTDSGYYLQQLTKEEFDDIEPNPNRTSPDTGQPVYYTIYSRSILLSPIPDKSTYLIEINWSKRPVVLSATTDTPSLGYEWDQIIKAHSLEHLYAGMGLMEDAAYWAGQYRGADGKPAGYCKTLFDVETDREGVIIGQVANNDL